MGRRIDGPVLHEAPFVVETWKARARCRWKPEKCVRRLWEVWISKMFSGFQSNFSTTRKQPPYGREKQVQREFTCLFPSLGLQQVHDLRGGSTGGYSRMVQ